MYIFHIKIIKTFISIKTYIYHKDTCIHMSFTTIPPKKETSEGKSDVKLSAHPGGPPPTFEVL